MADWQEALWLSKREISVSGWGVIVSFLFSAAFTFLLITGIHSYLDNGFVGLDFLFIIIFTIGPFWARPKPFQIQRSGNSFYSSPLVTTMLQLPIKRIIIIKSRIITCFIYAIPGQLFMLVCLYTFSSTMQQTIPFLSYCIFAFIWFCFSIYAGMIFITSEVGERAIFPNEAINIVISMIVSFGIIILLLTLLHLLLGNGVIYGTLYIAKNWPIASTTLSIIAAIFGLKYGLKTMEKRIRELDYF